MPNQSFDDACIAILTSDDERCIPELVSPLRWAATFQ